MQGTRFHGPRPKRKTLLVSSILSVLILALLALMNSARLGELIGDHTSHLPSVREDPQKQFAEYYSKTELPYTGFFPNHTRWQHGIQNQNSLKIAITSTTSSSLDQILPWLYYHRVIGVTYFFLFVEGKATSFNSTSILEAIPGVKIIPRTKELEEKQAQSQIWKETWLNDFFYKPCNSELFVKQTLNMEMGIVFAREIGVDWIIHIDTDELLHPAGASEYSLQSLLQNVVADVDMVIFPNYESAVERDDIQEPFSEVTLFKKNYDHVDKKTYFALNHEATRGNPNYFLTYGNGKAAARIQPHLRPNGAHGWYNYAKTPTNITHNEGAVLHYSYAKFSDLTTRRDRCHCKLTKEDMKRCFMLEFDQHAFIIASTASQEQMMQWYREHVVWTNATLTSKLMQHGLLTRLYAPQAIVQGLQDAGVFREAVAADQARLEKSLQENAVRSSSSMEADIEAPPGRDINTLQDAWNVYQFHNWL